MPNCYTKVIEVALREPLLSGVILQIEVIGVDTVRRLTVGLDKEGTGEGLVDGEATEEHPSPGNRGVRADPRKTRFWTGRGEYFLNTFLYPRKRHWDCCGAFF